MVKVKRGIITAGGKDYTRGAVIPAGTLSQEGEDRLVELGVAEYVDCAGVKKPQSLCASKGATPLADGTPKQVTPDLDVVSDQGVTNLPLPKIDLGGTIVDTKTKKGKK